MPDAFMCLSHPFSQRRRSHLAGRARGLALFLPVVTAALGIGCSNQSSPTQPTAHAVTGNVTITGELQDMAGNPTGTRVVGDGNGIRVYLVRSGAVVDSALTVAGSYRLVGQSGQGYQVSAPTGPTLDVSSAAFAIGNTDVVVSQPLQLASIGALSGNPNPFTTDLAIRFDLAPMSDVALSVFSLDGLRVRALAAQSLPPGPYSYVWDGRNEAGQAVADGAYWIAFSAAGREEVEAIFKGP